MYNSAIYLVKAYAYEYKIRHLGFIIHFDTMVSFTLMPMFTILFKSGLHVRTAYFLKSCLHLFLRSELNSNTQVIINLVVGRFKFWIIVFQTKDTLCQVSLKLSQWFWRRNSSMTFFAISLSSLLGKGSDPSFKQTWIPITSGCFVPNLFEIGLEFWRTRFLNFFNLFRYFRYFVPLKKGGLLCKQT